MKLAHHFYAVLGLVTLLSAVSLSSSGFGSTSNPLAVRVTNIAADAVPTAAQGTTQVGGTVAGSSLPAVQIASGQTVGISGTPSVNVSTLPAVQLDGSASVGINNTNSNPVPVTVAVSARQPVLVNTALRIEDGVAEGSVLGAYTVPAGKRLVIQYIFGQASLPDGQRLSLGTINIFPVHFTDSGMFLGELISDATIQVNYTLLADTRLDFPAFRSGSSGIGRVFMGFSGYLEDAP